jgi:hypothetical protein
MTHTPTKQLLRVHEVAAYLERSTKTISRWIALGLLHKIPGTSFIARMEVERFLQDGGAPQAHGGKRGRYNLRGKAGRSHRK